MDPIYSMTGFGRAEGMYKHKHFVIEIRSLNSKGLDLTVKMPSFYREKEFEVRNRLADALTRGKIDFSLSVELDVSETASKINSALFFTYYAQLQEIYSKLNHSIDNQTLSSITRFPDIFETPKDVLTDEEWIVVDALISKAIDDCLSYRSAEGKSLVRDLETKINNIGHLLEKITVLAPTREKALRERLMTAFGELSQPEKFDPNRFEQEIIYYLEKMDINEEQIRLSQHIRYFGETIRQGGAIGRKLGFIAQEMGREINTMGSKAYNFDIQQLVVQMKDNLEQIKEQVLNLL